MQPRVLQVVGIVLSFCVGGTVFAEDVAQTKILFTTSVQREGPDFFTINMDGSGLERITFGLGGFNPSFSRDGRRITFHKGSEVYVMNSDGTGVTRLTTEGGLYARFSPDGSRIVFVSARDGFENAIYVMNADGSDQVRLTGLVYEDKFPSFSPDGSKIVYQSNRASGTQLFLMDADGRFQKQITQFGGRRPRFSPDGGQIVYVRRCHIHLLQIGGTNEQRRLTSQSLNTAPDWSPDGSKIAFMSNRKRNGSELYIMNADGSDEFELGFHASWPSFGPHVVSSRPRSFVVTRGVRILGGLEDLFDSDDEYLWIRARRPPSVSQPSVQLVLESDTGGRALYQLKFTLEAGAVLDDTFPQRIELFDFLEQRWETVDERPARSDDAVVEVTIDDDADRFVRQPSGQMKARLSWFDPGVPFAGWSIRIDRAVWTITLR